MPRILIIDHDQGIRFVLKEMLWDSRYEVEAVSDGKLALVRMRQQPADLVITEMVMPEMEGVAIILGVRREFPAAKIIAMSGGGLISANDYLRLARTLGAHQAIAKPFTRDEMLKAVENLLTAQSNSE